MTNQKVVILLGVKVLIRYGSYQYQYSYFLTHILFKVKNTRSYNFMMCKYLDLLSLSPFGWPRKHIKEIITLWYLNADTYVAVFTKLIKVYYLYKNHLFLYLAKLLCFYTNENLWSYDHVMCNYFYFNMVNLCSATKIKILQTAKCGVYICVCGDCPGIKQ